MGSTGRADPAATLAGSDPRIDQLLLVDGPEPVAATPESARSSRTSSWREGTGDNAATAPCRIATKSLAMAESKISESVATLQAIVSRTSDSEPALATRLAPYLQSGRPAQLVRLTGAEMSEDLASIAAKQKLRTGYDCLACVTMETPASLLASDRERDAFGNVLIDMLDSARIATHVSKSSLRQACLVAV